jgi:hypothetical protein
MLIMENTFSKSNSSTYYTDCCRYGCISPGHRQRFYHDHCKNPSSKILNLKLPHKNSPLASGLLTVFARWKLIAGS